MIWANIIIVSIILLYAWDGFRRGFLRATVDLLGIVSSIIIALKFYPWANSLFQSWGLNAELAKPVGFLALWIIFQGFFYFIIWQIFRLVPDKWEANIVNRSFGTIPGAIKGLLTIAIVLMIFIVWPISTQTKDTLAQSSIAGFLIRISARAENEMNQIFGNLDNLTFFSNVGQDHEMTKLNFKVNIFTIDTAGEEQMLYLVNADRARAGLAPLNMDKTIREAARAHSIDMAQNGYFSHYDLANKTPADRLSDFQVNFIMVGENIALAPTAELAEIGFMNSEKHRDNILTEEFTRIGIGIIDTDSYGKMVTQNFAN